ncbi:MAG: DHH family phosphoesterase, partial [Enterococcus sp.]
MKNKPQIKWSFFFLCLLLIQLAAIFLLPFTILTAGIVILIDLLLWIYTVFLRNRIEISNQQKIQYASHRAQEALDYVSEDMPVGIITWDENNTFIWTNPAITKSVQDLTKEDQQDMVNELLQRAEKGKSIYKIGDILYHFDLNHE